MRTMQISLRRPAPRVLGDRRQPHAGARGEDGRIFSTLVAVGAVGLSSVVGVIVLTASGGVENPAGRAVLHVLAVAAPVATGLYAVRSGYVRFGWQLIAAGFVWSL